MRKRICALLIATLAISMFAGCNNGKDVKNTNSTEKASTQVESSSAMQLMDQVSLPDNKKVDDKYRNYYEIFPYTFCDSNGDGIGDINGITSKLDYISEMGIDAIWLTPIHESMTYHKYDVVDYYSIDKQFGTMEDFENFIAECDKRGIKVIMDLVVNHTSSANDWFYETKEYLQELGDKEPNVKDCKYLEYYNFTKEYETGYTQIKGTDWYYESRFWSEMPDLNLDNKAVRDEITKISKFWLDKGVSGFRLDATTSYYTGNDEKNIEFLKWINTMVKSQKEDAYLIGECWVNSSVYTKYYSSGIDSFFNFDFADNKGAVASVMRGSSAKELGKHIVDVENNMKANNEAFIGAAFTSNHDTGRSAGFYAGDYSEAMTKMGQGITMMMGGCYYLYYGDEIGMKGSGDDENKRAPMVWHDDSEADGMCKGVTTKSIDMKYGSVDSQLENGDSIYNYVREGLKLRNAYPEIARGTTTVNESLSDDSILVLEKDYNGEKNTIVMNTSAEKKEVKVGNDALKLSGLLLTSTENATYEAGVATMPAYSIMLLK